ncbi:MAG: flagellar hook-associated protein FlgK [Planctomycetota bacterium]|nr:flagellar hook-associated protein FlgK [Planctomycetota bacterium]
MSQSLNIGLRALLTSQSALDTIGHNVANANTAGFSRQSLLVSSSRPLNLRGLQVGNGVGADQVVRSVDELLNGRIVRQTSTLSRLDAQLVEMQSVEALLNEPGGDGFGGLLDDIFAGMSALSANTEDIVNRTGVIQSTENLLDRFHQVASEVSQLQRDAQSKARAIASDVNVLAERIVGLNAEISQVEAVRGTVANDLRDQRDLALQRLAERVEIRVRENRQGAVQVQVDGQLLVGARSINPMEVETTADGGIVLSLRGGVRPVEPRGGEIAGLVAFSEEFAASVGTNIDQYARAIVLEMNRAHTTGVPLDGGFTQLRGANLVRDVDGDGELGDGLLRDVDLPFDVQRGELFVHVTREGSDELITRRIEIDPDRMTVQDFLDEIESVPELNARLDNFGRVDIDASSGTRFHFGRPVDTRPDADGTFGGARASRVSSFGGPFSISGPTNLVIGALSVEIDPSSFEVAGKGTAEEIAAILNADEDFSDEGLRARVVGDRLAIQTEGEGAGESFEILAGGAATLLGLEPGTSSGQDLAVEVALSGQYTGPANDRWTFEALGDGTIGTTPGLEVAVRDSQGAIIATLDVGEGYAPGNPILVADGVSVSFSVGDVSASEGDAFSTELIADSDTSDVLVALGLNSFLTGTDATTIDMRDDIRADPRLFAASATGSVGDSGALLDMIGVQTKDVAELGGTLGEFYGSIVGDVGFEISSTSNAQEIESFLLESLTAQREEVSGVNVDEELVKMIQFEQAYSAAAQFLQVVTQLNDQVMALV